MRQQSGKGHIVLTPYEGKHERCIIFLHGFGGTSFEYQDLFDGELNPFTQKCKIVIPLAPLRYTKLEPAFRMHAWYDFTLYDDEADESA
jgi:predicted esterase